MIVDHLRWYADEAAAIADLPQFRGTEGWAGNLVAGVRVVLAEAVYGESDPETGEREIVTPEVLAEGFYVLISRRGLDPVLVAGPAARLATDREAALRGEPFGLFCSDFAVANAVVKVEPTPVGAAYPFGDLVMVT